MTIDYCDFLLFFASNFCVIIHCFSIPNQCKVFHASFSLVLSILPKVFLFSLAGNVLQSLLGAKTVRASYDSACIVVGKYCFFPKVDSSCLNV